MRREVSLDQYAQLLESEADRQSFGLAKDLCFKMRGFRDSPVKAAVLDVVAEWLGVEP